MDRIPRPTSAMIVVLMLLCWQQLGGCSNANHGSAVDTGSCCMIECKYNEPPFLVRAYGEGVAQIERLDRKDNDPIRTIVLPVDKQKVRRLANVLERIATDSGTISASRPGQDWLSAKRLLLYPTGPRSKEVKWIDVREGGQDLLLFGLMGEFEDFTFIDLAKAVFKFESANQLRAEGKTLDSVSIYEHALMDFKLWGEHRAERFGWIWEPEVAFGMDYPAGGVGPATRYSGGVFTDVMKLPEITPEWAVKILLHSWEIETKGIEIRRSGNMIEVEFTKGSEHWGLHPAEAPTKGTYNRIQ